MIPAAHIEDQELPIRPERTSIHNPAVARRGDLRAGAGGDGNALFQPASTVGRPELLQFDPVNRDRNLSAQRSEGDSGVNRPGSRNADKAGRLSLRAASRAARIAGSRPCSSLAIKSLRLSTLRSEE